MAFDLDAILKLSVAERLKLIDLIWSTIGDAPTAEELPLTEAEKTLLAERWEEYRRNPEAVTTWEEAEARIRGRRRR